MTGFVITIELDLDPDTLTDAQADVFMTALAHRHVAGSRSPMGRLQLTLTLDAADLAAATTTALAEITPMTQQLHAPALGLSVQPETDRDQLEAFIPNLSVTQAAQAMGITRQGVLKAISTGRLAATRVGHTWSIPAGALPAGASLEGDRVGANAGTCTS